MLESASYSIKVVNSLKKFQTVKGHITSEKSSTSMPKDEVLVITEKVKPVEMKVKKEAVETKVKEEETIIIKTEDKPAEKKRKIDTNANKNGRKEWLRAGGIKLRMEDRDCYFREEA